MINPKFERVLFSLLMSLFMSFFMSFIITLMNIGLINNFVFIWLSAFWKAFLIAFPTVFVVVPQVRKLTNFLIKK